MQYEVYGPFDAPRFSTELSGVQIRDFWDNVESREEGLSRAVGIYVFSTCSGEKYKPWYVGKTNAAGGFRAEIFQPHKRAHYISAAALKKGKPRLHLIPRVEPKRGYFSRASARAGAQIDVLETAIIGMALNANPDVRNSKKTWFVRNCYVPGIFGPPERGKRPEGVRTLRNTLGLSDRMSG